MAEASGVEAQAISRAALTTIVDRIMDGEPLPQGHWPWVLTLGTRGARRAGGTQLCPACLAEDETPYYRVQWRLAWHTACERHGLGLLDRCPQCRSALAPHRLRPDARHIARCAACGLDLRRAAAKESVEGALSLQRAADAVVREGEGDCLGTATTAGAWLASAAFLARLVRRAARAPIRGLERLLAAAECEPLPGRGGGTGTSIERLGVEERTAMLDAVSRLMGLGAAELGRAVETAGLTRQGWCEQGETVPAPLARVVPPLPESHLAGAKRPRRTRRKGPRPRHEVRQMMARLERAAGVGAG